MDNYEHAFDDLLGYEEVKRELKAILCTMGKEKQAAELGAKVPSGLFLYGGPGNGKTAFAKAFMKASLRPSFVLGPSEDYIEKLRQAVEEAAAAAPSCLLLDDFDKVSDEKDEQESIGAIQGILDAGAGRGIYFIMTADSLDDIPESFYRKGRVDHFLNIEPPDRSTGAEIILKIARGFPGGDGLNKKDLAGLGLVSTCAKARSFANEAVMAAVDRGGKEVTIDDFVEAFYGLRSKIDDEKESEAVLLEKAAAVAAKALVSETVEEGTVGFLSIRSLDSLRFHPRRRPGAIATLLAGPLGAELALGMANGNYAGDYAIALESATDGYLHTGSLGVGMTFNGNGVCDNFVRQSKQPFGELLLPISANVRRFLVANRPILLKLAARLRREPYLLRTAFEEFLKENPVDPRWLSTYR